MAVELVRMGWVLVQAGGVAEEERHGAEGRHKISLAAAAVEVETGVAASNVKRGWAQAGMLVAVLAGIVAEVEELVSIEVEVLVGIEVVVVGSSAVVEVLVDKTAVERAAAVGIVEAVDEVVSLGSQLVHCSCIRYSVEVAAAGEGLVVPADRECNWAGEQAGVEAVAGVVVALVVQGSGRAAAGAMAAVESRAPPPPRRPPATISLPATK